jgi:hypothetical protein
MGWFKSNASTIGILTATTVGAIALVGSRSLGWKLGGAAALTAAGLYASQKVKS